MSAILDLAQREHPLVFGLECPWCEKEHILSALGAGVQNEAGEEVAYEPTLGLIEIDPEEEVGVVKCWDCHRVFRFHICVIVPEKMDDVLVN